MDIGGMLEDIRDGGPPTVDQYVVLNWTMREGNVTGDFWLFYVSFEISEALVGTAIACFEACMYSIV